MQISHCSQSLMYGFYVRMSIALLYADDPYFYANWTNLFDIITIKNAIAKEHCRHPAD